MLEAEDATPSLGNAGSAAAIWHCHSSSSAQIWASSRVAIASTSYTTVMIVSGIAKGDPDIDGRKE